VCRAKSEGGRRCNAHLKELTGAQLLPPQRPDVPALAWAGEGEEEPQAIFEAWPNSIANAALNALLEVLRHEPAMTEQIQTAVNACPGATLKGLDNRLKSPSSLARKIQTKGRERRIPYGQGGAGLDDTIRYTVTTDRLADLVPTLEATISTLTAQGWSVHSAEQSFVQGNPYKGIHLILAGPGGQRSEVQFHTRSALDIKSRGHKQYKIYRDTSQDDATRKAAFNKCVALWDSVPTPPGLRRLDTIGGITVQAKDYRERPRKVEEVQP